MAERRGARPARLDGDVLDAQHFDLAHSRRTLETHDVCLARPGQRARQRRHPADAIAREIGLVDADDLVGLLVAVLVGDRHRRAEKDLIETLLPRRRIDDLGKIEALGQETDTPVDLAQAPLPVDVVAVFRAIAVRRRPMHDFDDMRPLDAQQVVEFILDTRIAAGRDVVARPLRQGRRRFEFVIVVAVVLTRKGFVHANQ